MIHNHEVPSSILGPATEIQALTKIRECFFDSWKHCPKFGELGGLDIHSPPLHLIIYSLSPLSSFFLPPLSSIFSITPPHHLRPFLTTFLDLQKKHFFKHINDNLHKDKKINRLQGFHPTFYPDAPNVQPAESSHGKSTIPLIFLLSAAITIHHLHHLVIYSPSLHFNSLIHYHPTSFLLTHHLISTFNTPHRHPFSSSPSSSTPSPPFLRLQRFCTLSPSPTSPGSPVLQNRWGRATH